MGFSTREAIAGWLFVAAWCGGCTGPQGILPGGKDGGADASTGAGGSTEDAGPRPDAGPTVDAGGGGDAAPDAAPPDPDAPRPSAGCGKAAQGGFSQVATSAPVNGAPRAYWVAAPDGLPSSAPQKVVFVWHGCGGSVTNIRTNLTIEDQARAAQDQAIFVYPQIGTATDPSASEGCFDSVVDQLYFLQVLADVEGAYCLDENKVFTAGYSSGGIMSDLIGCFHADLVRAVVPVEGGLPSMQGQCPGRVDALVIHSPLDEQIGWNQPDTQTSHSWTDGRGVVPLQFFYGNDGCTVPAFDPGDATIGRTDFTCGVSGDGVHPYRVSRWLHDYGVPWATDTPHHWFPPEAPAAIWAFIAATP